MTDFTPIGIIGINDMGEVIARRLAEHGHNVLAYDASPERRPRLAGLRPRIDIAGNLFDLAAETDTIIALTDTTDELTAAVLGTEDRPGLRARFAPGGLIIDMTSGGKPRETVRLQGFLGTRGIGLTDAALFGTAADAAAGRLLFLNGGFPDFTERARPILELLGSIIPTGQLGTGHAAAALLTETRSKIADAETAARTQASQAGIRADALIALLEVAGLAWPAPVDSTPTTADAALTH